MRPIIEARIEGDDVDPTVVPIPLAVIDRRDDDLEQLGLSLAEGRELLGAVQSVMVSSQASIWVATQDYCHHCHTPLRRKDTRPSRHAYRVWQCVGQQPAILDLRLRPNAKPGDAHHRPVEPGLARARHTRIGVFADQMGGAPAARSRHEIAERGSSAAKELLRQWHPAPNAHCRQSDSPGHRRRTRKVELVRSGRGTAGIRTGDGRERRLCLAQALRAGTGL